jgi:hypothetical protein
MGLRILSADLISAAKLTPRQLYKGERRLCFAVECAEPRRPPHNIPSPGHPIKYRVREEEWDRGTSTLTAARLLSEVPRVLVD